MTPEAKKLHAKVNRAKERWELVSRDLIALQMDCLHVMKTTHRGIFFDTQECIHCGYVIDDA